MSQTKVDLVKRSLAGELQGLGLSPYESLAYLALVSNSPSPASLICKETGIPDSKIYYVLESLRRKGMILTQEGTPKLYRSLSPKEAMRNLRAFIQSGVDEKLQRLDSLAKKLAPLYEIREGSSEIEVAYVVRGISNIVTKMKEAVKEAHKEVTIFLPSARLSQALKEELRAVRRRNVRVRLAVSRSLLEHDELPPHNELKVLTPGCEDCFIVIVDNRHVIAASNYSSDKAYAIMTQDPLLVSITNEYFESPRCCLTA